MFVRSLAITLALSAACGGKSPAPAQPAEPVPLPPSSGSPISYLVDDAADLKLSTDQLDKLREIDTSLAAELDQLDATDRAANAPPPDATASAPPMGGGRHRGGGMRGGGGGMRGSRNGGGRHRTTPGQGGGASKASTNVADEKRADVKDALARAFVILDEDQRAKATKVLADRGVDLVPAAATQPPSGETEQAPEEGSAPDEP